MVMQTCRWQYFEIKRVSSVCVAFVYCAHTFRHNLNHLIKNSTSTFCPPTAEHKLIVIVMHIDTAAYTREGD